MKNQLLVVVVLYQQSLSHIPSYDLFSKAVFEKKIQLVVYDNSRETQTDPLFETDNVLYYHDGENPGLAKAYNYALAHAKKEHSSFVLLDQDSRLSESYFDELLQIIWVEDQVAAVPMVYDHGRQISPVYADQYVNRQVQMVDKPQLVSDRLMAINSGAAFSIDFLKEIGGFNVDFPLDFLDHWLFWKIHQRKKKVAVLPQKIEHDLSVLDYTKVNVNRYRSILQAETLFYQNYDQGLLKKHRKQLLLRTAKQFLTVKNRKIWRLTLQSFAENWKV